MSLCPKTNFYPGRNRHRESINKQLSEDAYAILGEETRTTITELIDILKTAFGSRRTLLDCYANLKHLQQDQGEDILHYIDRTMTLHQEIIEAETHEKGCITDTISSEINSKVSIAFCLGLPCMIQLILRHSNYSLPSELFIEVILHRRRAKITRRGCVVVIKGVIDLTNGYK